METVSICRRFNAALAETLTGDTQAAATLQSIEDENLLIMRAESEDRSPWYRFHPLLVEFLAVRLARRGTEAVNALHRRASLWFAEHGLVVEAIRHATLGQDVASAIAVIERSAPTAWRVSYLGPLHHVINNVAPESMVSHPRLLYLGALTLAITGRHARAATWLEQLRASDPANTRETASRVALASALGALQRDDTARALELLAPFEDGADSGGGATRSAFESHILGSTLAASLAAAGRYAEAHRVLDAHPMNPDDGDSVLLLAGCRPIVLLVEGRVAEAGQASTHTRTVAMYGSRSAWAGMSAAVLASVLYEQDRVEEAGELLANRLHGLGASSPEIMIRAMLCQVRLDLLQDSAEAALALLERQANFFRSIGLDRAVAYAGAEQARLLIAQGDRRAAVESIARLAPIAAAHARADGFRAEIPAIVALARARLELARDNHDDALREADTALEIAARLGRNSMRVVGELVAAMILHAGGRPTEALGRLARAVASAPGLGLVRTFLDEGEPLYPLLRALQDHPALDDDTREYAADLLRRFERHDRAPSRQDAGADPQVSLTPRELEMVGLIAAGMSNKRIAQTLNIRLETVKWNLKNVFVKLEVSSRYDAMMRARRLGLIK
jgi:LuxR family maltose regulon positive regulatory protein